MKILIVSATKKEIQPFIDQVQAFSGESQSDLSFDYKAHNIEILISGIGAAASSYSLTKKLLSTKFDLVINAGIAGSYDHDVEPGRVFMVTSEVFSDLGAETDGVFQSVFDLGLVKQHQSPFEWGILNARPFYNLPGVLDHLPRAKGYTVNKLPGRRQVSGLESMEGAAVFYVCLLEEIAFVQLRAVSNRVGEADRSKWDIPMALKSLATELIRLLDDLQET